MYTSLPIYITSDYSLAKSAINLLHADLGIDIQ